MTSKLTEQQQKRFDEKMEHEFHDCAAHDQGQYCCLDKEHKRNQIIKQHLADEIAMAKEEDRKSFIGFVFSYTQPDKGHLFGVIDDLMSEYIGSGWKHKVKEL